MNFTLRQAVTGLVLALTGIIICAWILGGLTVNGRHIDDPSINFGMGVATGLACLWVALWLLGKVP